MVKVMYLSDLHEDLGKLERAAQISKEQGVDFVGLAGDLIGKDHTSREKNTDTLDDKLMKIEIGQTNQIKNIYQTYKIGSQEDFDALDESIKEEVSSKQEQLIQGNVAKVVKAVQDSYEKIKPALEKLKQSTKSNKIVGVLGNHDLKLGYKALEDVVTFAELRDEVNVAGFKIKGTNNTWELPKIYSPEKTFVGRVLSQYFINYAEGNPDTSEEGVKEANDKTYKRLTKTGPADILLTHVVPDYHRGQVIKHGKATQDYAKIAKSTYGGHFHDGQVILKDGKVHATAGAGHAMVCEYDENNEVKAVEIYKL